MKLNLSAALRRVGAHDGGNVAILAGIAIVPLTIAALGAVDLTRGVAARVELQDALDAAALAAGRSSTTDETQLQAIGDRILKQNLSAHADFTLTGSSFTIGANNQILASAQATFQPLLGGLGGGDGASEIAASTEVQRANSILEIAMVLDNTGSMDDKIGTYPNRNKKIVFLKTAATSFVDSMTTAASQSSVPNAIRIALVPFSNLVNVGSTYKTAAWVDQTGASPINNQIFTTKQSSSTTLSANRFTLFNQLGVSWGGCVEMRKAPNDIQDTAPDTFHPETLFTPFFAPDEQDGIKDHNGNVADNDYVKDPTKDAQGATLDTWGKQGAISKYTSGNKSTDLSSFNTSRGPNAGCTMQSIQRLSTDFASLKTAINNMTPNGDTNIPLGLMWGWHMLSPSAPFADGVAYLTPKHRKVVVLMTDGENTMTPNSYTINKSSSSAAGYIWQGRFLQADGAPLNSTSADNDTRTAAMNDRLTKLCSNMKDASKSIEIYVIGVGVVGANRTMLQSCASGDDHYFDATDGTTLTSAFQTIANQISQLHLSK